MPTCTYNFLEITKLCLVFIINKTLISHNILRYQLPQCRFFFLCKSDLNINLLISMIFLYTSLKFLFVFFKPSNICQVGNRFSNF